MSANEPPLKSRKFVAFLIAEMTWKLLLGVLLVLEMKEGTIRPITGALGIAVIVVAGFMEALYIGGQAALDRYTNVAQIAAQAGQPFNMGGMEFPGRNPPPRPPERDPTHRRG